MVAKGKYKIVQILNASNSLLSSINRLQGNEELTTDDQFRSRDAHDQPTNKHYARSTKSTKQHAVSTKHSPASPGKYDVHKAMISNETAKCLVYFVDPIDFGKNSLIEIKRDQSVPLLRKEDYELIYRTEYMIDLEFIQRLFKGRL